MATSDTSFNNLPDLRHGVSQSLQSIISALLPEKSVAKEGVQVTEEELEIIEHVLGTGWIGTGIILDEGESENMAQIHQALLIFYDALDTDFSRFRLSYGKKPASDEGFFQTVISAIGSFFKVIFTPITFMFSWLFGASAT